jgi:hypothetical protein
MGTFIIILLVYVLGFFLSILVLKKYAKQWDMDGYDPPHGDYYDDYSSNAEAYMSWSLGWPIFWLFTGIFGFFSLLKKLVQKILDL